MRKKREGKTRNMRNIMKKRFIFLIFISIIIIISSFIVNINLANSNSNELGELKVTLEHPFLVDNEWIPARELQVGDELTTIDGKKVRITSIEKIQSEEEFEVYNLETKENNYVVSGRASDEGVSEGVVVHNSQNLLPSPKEIKLLPAPKNCKYPDGTKIPLYYISTQDVNLKNVRPGLQNEIIRKIGSGEWVELRVSNINPCEVLKSPAVSFVRYWGPKEYLGKPRSQLEIAFKEGRLVKTHEYGYYEFCPLFGKGGNLPTGHRHFHLEFYFHDIGSNGEIILR